ncbi:DUF1236 domain-containing protein [Bradyrhizobium neotropicale]|uniref:DUF1236 domain-containing protein n=1 Tax=Bradyrhizobium neotropicale TaxID=1497615 RepID=UPI001AD62454|nr:DUF1236 domain-containing protein [Bradyrhizobium neotropicale]MBO4223680.1 DUF1236 domain-containing protein [Bradyrhizobium neotropicale]
MRMNWLYTTAIALTIGASAAIAQAPDQSPKREESPRAQAPTAQSKDMDRSGAQSREMDRSGAADRAKERAQSEQKGGTRDMQRGEGSSPAERSKQAQEPQGRESREPTRQSQDQDRRERPPASASQQGREDQKGRDAKEATEQQRSREDRTGRDRAQDTRQPADTRQQSQQQMDRDRRDQRDQAAQPSGTSTQQQSSRPSDTTQDQGTKTGQASGQAGQRAANVNDDQRKQIVDQLRSDRTATRTSNVSVNIGQRLPPSIQPHRLPADIVRIAPQYRDYDYTLVDDRVVIVDPRRHEVVDILDEGPGYGGAGYGRERIVISDDMRTRFRELARGSSTTVGAATSSGGTSASNCLSLQPVPEEMVRNNAELRNYRYLAVGDQIVLVDPQQQKIVQVIE